MSGFIFALIFVQIVSAQLEESVQVDLVETYVSVLDKKGNPITDLNATDFEIKEDGIKQPIAYFTRILDEESQIPLTLGFLLDTSGSMGKGDKIQRIDIARQFANFLIKELKPADQMRVYGFDNIYRALTPMTSDLGSIQQSLADVKIDTVGSPGTALLTSIDLTIEQLESHFGRKIIVVCSDGQNTIPGPAPETLIEKLKKQDITVISLATITNREWKAVDTGVNVRYERPKEDKEAQKLMKELAEETGGASFFLENVSHLTETMEKIRSMIRSQYAIAYKPPNEMNKGWRKIEVKCKRDSVKLNYRKGYYFE
ncbi:MAG TPA: VWA domain-containing protein [Acidobacteriota bacterium]|nr:VWA domain-containing protein [Acidobacteriota bacterium]